MMQPLLTASQEHVYTITLNRVDKHNAFNAALLDDLYQALNSAVCDPEVRIILLQANGRHFSAGADLAWMQQMITLSEDENRTDAARFAHILNTLYQCPKPTIALVHGANYGGGIGLMAACDIAVAADNARFCFSEVSLGLVPAVISPYVIRAIGERSAMALFLSAEIFDAQRAHALHLVHDVVAQDQLATYGSEYAQRLAMLPPHAMQQAKSLVRHVGQQPIDAHLLDYTAQKIAELRVLPEAQQAFKQFFKRTPG